MTIQDDVNRILREFKRYTGDGLANAPTSAPLPIGDPQSGVHNPKKSDLREMLLPIAEGIDEINAAVPEVNAARDVALAAIDANEAAALEAIDEARDEVIDDVLAIADDWESLQAAVDAAEAAGAAVEAAAASVAGIESHPFDVDPSGGTVDSVTIPDGYAAGSVTKVWINGVLTEGWEATDEETVTGLAITTDDLVPGETTVSVVVEVGSPIYQSSIALDSRYKRNFDTADGLSTRVVPNGVNAIETGGRSAVGDRGRAFFINRFAQPDYGFYTDRDGRFFEYGDNVANVLAFGGALGLDPDGTETDSTACIDALNWLFGKGGGALYIPRGTYVLGDDASIGLFNLQDMTDIHIFGDGAATIIKNADGSDCQGIYLRDVERCSVRSLLLDGNKANQTTSVHNIRADGDDIRLVDLICKDPAGYNIAVGQSNHVKRFMGSRLTLSGAVADAFDSKNKDNTNAGNSLSQVTVVDFGLGGPTMDANTEKAGIDLRGPWQLNQITVHGVAGDDAGIRFRPGEPEDENGDGAHRSILTNFHVYADENDSGNTTIGVNVGARNVTVACGYVRGGRQAVLTNNSDTSVVDVTSENARVYGFRSIEGTSTQGVRALFARCKAFDGAGSGFQIGADHNTLESCVSTENDGDGCVIESTANRTTLNDCYLLTNTGSSLVDNGTNTINWAPKGLDPSTALPTWS